MVTSVAARFHFDGEEWPLTRLERWYRRDRKMFWEEFAMLTPEQQKNVRDRMRALNGWR